LLFFLTILTRGLTKALSAVNGIWFKVSNAVDFRTRELDKHTWEHLREKVDKIFGFGSKLY